MLLHCAYFTTAVPQGDLKAYKPIQILKNICLGDNMRDLLVVSTLSLVSATAMAANCKAPVNLKDFHKDPKAFLNAPVIKLDKNCKAVSKSYFSQTQIESKEFIKIKDLQRSQQCHTTNNGASKICLTDIAPGQDVIQGRAPIESIDRAENLVDNYDSLETLEEMKEYSEGEVDKQPWSDWYWPIAVGQLSFRYADENFVEAYEYADLDEDGIWPFVNEYHEQHQATPADIAKLSPSEKYDILMGDANYTLTKKMLLAGKGYYDQYGKVESWMGLCHGWAPASYMLPRPIKTINVKAADGVTEIPFRPSDLKALGTLQWSTGASSTKFIGGRCNTKDPETDPDNGRILDQECFDNNPGTWHKAVVTQVGKNQKPFVMDATYDYEVWNHPVTAYELSFFNPKTMDEYVDLAEAKVAMAEFDNDKFKKYRSSNAKYVVGVMMEVEYLVETMPSGADTDHEYNDDFHSAYYVYDLELDQYGRIIGGEWYSNKHPDFLWTPYEGTSAESILDQYLPASLTMDQITHPQILPYVPQVSGNSQVIGRVVEALFREASKKEVTPVDESKE